MANFSILTALLFHVLCIMVQGIIVSRQFTNCSEYFTYITKPGTTNLLGRIKIPPPPLNEEYHLKIALNTNKVKKQNSIGIRDFQLELARPIAESVRAVHLSKPLLYNVYYPSHQPITTVSAIWFNNQQYCPGFESNISVTIELGHILFPPSEEPGSWLWHRNSSNYRIDHPSQHRLSYFSSSKHKIATPSVEIANNECGITNYYTDTTNNRYPNGQETLPGQWPWLVALFFVKNDRRPNIRSYQFQCAGTVLTTRHVMTAANCLKIGNDTVNPNILLVVMGRSNLRLHFRGEGTINRAVQSYTIHPDYAYADSGDADLAILTLKNPVKYSPFIKPICLWSGSTNVQGIINKKGYVVGWGDDELGLHYTASRMIRVPIVSQETCLRSNQMFFNFTSDRTFCAGGQDKNGHCNGDIGSGLVIFNNITGRYHLRGIASRVLFANYFFCDPKNYVVYVDVAQYIFWIQQEISVTEIYNADRSMQNVLDKLSYEVYP